MKSSRYSLAAFLLIVTLSGLLLGQQPAQSSAVVPRLVNFSGKATDAQGKVITGVAGVTLAIYKDQYDGAQLWMETQNIQPDSKGNYTVQLGAATSTGLPLDLFTSGEARWLGVRINGGEEQPRVLLLSVPYALKAADAQTVGGMPPSAFVLATPNATNVPAATASGSANSSSGPNVGGSGNQGYISYWADNNGNLGNSVLYQSGSGSSAKVGINLKNPLFTLDVNGSVLARGLTELATTSFATKNNGFNSQPLNFESSAFNSSTGKYTLNHFQWQAEPVGNNTTSPRATLNLLYGTDPNQPTETGLKLSSTGVFTFAPTQTFPGTGTVTSVGLSAPVSDFTVSGSPVTGSGTLALNWNVAPTSADTANAIVKRDGTGSFAAGNITSVTLTASNPAGVAIVGSTSGSNAAITGTSTGTNAVSDGVDGITSSATASGVAGINNGGGDGVYGTGGTGVFGQNGTLSTTGAEVITSRGVLGGGVWGDGGTTSANWGVIGTVDDGYAGIFENNSPIGYITLFAFAKASGTSPFFAGGPFGSCYIDGSGNLNCTGAKNAVVPINGGKRIVAMSAIESPQNWFEDAGAAELVNGSAVVTLDPDFIQTVNTEMDYKVFPVPNGDCKGLYVTNKTATSFEVRELGGGTSSIRFDYRIMALRKKYENVRFADHTNDPDPRKMLERMPTHKTTSFLVHRSAGSPRHQ